MAYNCFAWHPDYKRIWKPAVAHIMYRIDDDYGRFLRRCIFLLSGLIVVFSIILHAQSERERRAHNLAMLALCSPEFSRRAAELLGVLEDRGYHPYIRETFRNEVAQAFAQRGGRSEVLHGRHNEVDEQGNPAATALDFGVVSRFRRRERTFEAVVACTARQYDLETGIGWGLPAVQRADVEKVIATCKYDSEAFGWDPLHVQTVRPNVR